MKLDITILYLIIISPVIERLCIRFNVIIYCQIRLKTGIIEDIFTVNTTLRNCRQPSRGYCMFIIEIIIITVLSNKLRFDKTLLFVVSHIQNMPFFVFNI